MSGQPINRQATVVQIGVALCTDRDDLFDLLSERPSYCRRGSRCSISRAGRPTPSGRPRPGRDGHESGAARHGERDDLRIALAVARQLVAGGWTVVGLAHRESPLADELYRARADRPEGPCDAHREGDGGGRPAPDGLPARRPREQRGDARTDAAIRDGRSVRPRGGVPSEHGGAGTADGVRAAAGARGRRDLDRQRVVGRGAAWVGRRDRSPQCLHGPRTLAMHRCRISRASSRRGWAVTGLMLAAVRDSFARLQSRSTPGSFGDAWKRRSLLPFDNNPHTPRPSLERVSLLLVVRIAIVDARCSETAVNVIEHLCDVITRNSGFGHSCGGRPVKIVRQRLSLARGQEQSSRCRMWSLRKPNRKCGFRGSCEPIMECQDATARIAEYLVGSLRVEELDGLLTHAAACATCRDKLTETWRQLGRIPPAEFDAVLAGYKDGLSHRPRNIHPPRCATCHLSGQSCSWICRRRFIVSRAV